MRKGPMGNPELRARAHRRKVVGYLVALGVSEGSLREAYGFGNADHEEMKPGRAVMNLLTKDWEALKTVSARTRRYGPVAEDGYSTGLLTRVRGFDSHPAHQAD